LGRPVTSAQIRLFTTDASPDGGHVFVAGNGWTETAITFNNAPPTVGSQIGTLGAVTNGVWAELNLPPGTVTGEGSYTFAIVGQPTNSAYSSSRQGASPPELDLILGAAPSGPPVAGMTAAPTTGPAPLTVTFADASTGGPTSWAWDFGDGTSSTVQFPPAHVYTNAGTYTASLIASNATGPSAPATKTITVNPTGPPPSPPVAGMTAAPTTGPAPWTVTFADASTGGPTSWAWDFGDGTSSTAQFPPAHVYTNAGTYTARPIAATRNGPSAPATKTITVNPVGPPPSPPVAGMTAAPTTGPAPLTVTF